MHETFSSRWWRIVHKASQSHNCAQLFIIIHILLFINNEPQSYTIIREYCCYYKHYNGKSIEKFLSSLLQKKFCRARERLVCVRVRDDDQLSKAKLLAHESLTSASPPTFGCAFLVPLRVRRPATSKREKMNFKGKVADT